MKYLPPDQYQKYLEYRSTAKFEAQRRWRKRFYTEDRETIRALDALAREVAKGRIVA